jgi:DNA replication and repair protein RecF
MGLLRAEIRDFRCLQQLDLRFDPRYTVICGPNASGKTSLLEAIFFLGRGRSFRTHRVDRLVRHGASRFALFGETDQPRGTVGLGVEGSADGTRAKVAFAPARSLAELSLYLPIQVFDPEVHKLIEEGPIRRRRYLDWGAFHVEHDFIDHWHRYRQSLRQRNAALRSRASSAALQGWTRLVAESGEQIASSRQRYAELLTPVLSEFGQRLLGAQVTAVHHRGWAKDCSLHDALAANAAADESKGITQFGPHRADLTIRLNGVLAKDMISRGQQKLLAAALLLSQLRLLEASGIRAALLLDDPAAELDERRLAVLIELLRGLPLQLIATSLTTGNMGLGAPGMQYAISDGLLRCL